MEPDRASGAERAAEDLERVLAARGQSLLRTAVLLAGGREAGEDLLQAALERLLRRWRTIEGSPEAYLRRILYHLAADAWRRQRSRLAGLRLLRAGQPETGVDPIGQVDLRDAAATGDCSRILYTRESFGPGAFETPLPKGGEFALGTPDRRSAWSAGSAAQWSRCGHERGIVFGPAGRPVFGEKVVLGRNGGPTTAVIFGSRTWWRTGRQPSDHYPSISRGSVEVSVSRDGLPSFAWSPAEIRRQIRQELAEGGLKVAGHQRVDGTDTLKIVDARKAPLGLTYWVSPSTYLPVRVRGVFASWNIGCAARHPRGCHGSHLGWTEQIDFRWLPATPANLAHLHLRIPPGFTRVPAP